MCNQTKQKYHCVKLLVYSVLVFSMNACFVEKKRVDNIVQIDNRIIVYRVFDSLEQSLCADINKLKEKKDSVCILIEPFGDFTFSETRNKKGRYIYRVRLFYEHYYPRDSILEISNRKINLCGKLYPVYFPRIDDVFCKSDKTKNAIFWDNVLQENWDLYSTNYYIVDMANKTILFRR